MSCRSTRARAAKIVLEEPLEQTRKITDVFKVTRGRGRTQKKLHGEEGRVETKSLQALGLKECTDYNAQRSARKVLFAADDALASSPKKEVDVEVEEHAKVLKSPVKSVPKGSARVQVTSKAKHGSPQKASDVRLEPSTSSVPEFVLPTHKTPAKKSLDEFELNETRYLIRAKEAERKAAEKLKDPVIERKIELLQRILHGLLRCITTYFAFKKVRSMELRILSEQVMRSQSSMNRDLLMEHLTILCEVAPNYVAFAEFGGKKYLQMKENNYTAIEKVIQEELGRLRTSTASAVQPQQGVPVGDVAKKAVRALF
ncbi:hypothetical protein TELCIR_12119 [Teladorsagia circumcincta]|uniref:DNA replication factor Cdt1 C-terminal domain-containing protein n=1 Tax=Teladorsagia circumcincta TaxID=45464 RepID=A0A2G9U7M4_TELCI|nr:hypothetical protein TELCIR_12119 [Teladorsagia circumcincta]